MANVPRAYCAEEDLRTGDIAVPVSQTKAQYILNAAEEIEAALGHVYVTPILISATVPEYRPSILILKKVNWLLASGRFIIDVAAAGEADNLHALGRRYLDEASLILGQILSGEIPLTGAPKIESGGDENVVHGPIIFQEDDESLVQGFYERFRPNPFGCPRPPVVPYGQE